MTSESFFALVIGGFIALLFGSALLFAGYRFFIVLLPIFGFFLGFVVGAQAIQNLFGDAFLSTVTSWVVGFIVALLFAVLAYVAYVFAVAIISFGLGYAVVEGLFQAIGVNPGFFVWLVAVIVGIIVAGAALVLNVQKLVVIVATAILGAGTIIATFLYLFGGVPETQIGQNPVRIALQASPFWTISFIVLAVLGIAFQLASTRSIEVESYNRMSELGVET
jgi:hypothetical protein